MGWWSSLKKKVKKAWTGFKAFVRAVVRYVIEFVMRVINLVLVWLPIQKKMRIQVFILRKGDGEPVLNQNGLQDLQNNLDVAIKIYKEKFDILMKPYGNPLIQTLPKPAPSYALNPKCLDGGAASDEWSEAGEYFASNLAGWNVIPLGFKFPITIFVVQPIPGAGGCSLKERTDYVTVTIAGIDYRNTLAHELGHCCSLRHHESDTNLMYENAGSGNEVTRWQKFVVRNSRHCTFW